MELVKRDPRGQGDRGELSAALWFASQDAAVFIPLFHSPRDFDLIADWQGAVRRVQVKTSTYVQSGRWGVTLCARGGNRSWDGLVKRLDPTRYDYLFVLVGDGRRWLIPASEVGGGSGLTSAAPSTPTMRSNPASRWSRCPRR